MLLALLLAGAALPAHSDANLPKTNAAQHCFDTMDGAVYHGDPSDRKAMRTAVATCIKGTAQIQAVKLATPAAGPEKLFLTGRLLDRTATLAYMGLGDWAMALHRVTLANLYFRVASGLAGQPGTYHEAAVQNVQLTDLQLSTLRAEVAAHATPAHARLTAYHKL